MFRKPSQFSPADRVVADGVVRVDVQMLPKMPGATAYCGAERSLSEKSRARARFRAVASRTVSGRRFQRHSIIYRIDV